MVHRCSECYMMDKQQLLNVAEVIKRDIGLLDRYYGQECGYKTFYLVTNERGIQSDGLCFWNGTNEQKIMDWYIIMCQNEEDEMELFKEWRLKVRVK